jgi:regulatory protein
MPDDQAPPPPPDEAALHEAALAHLARYGATRATLTRVLNRRVQRWALRIGGPDAAAQAAAARQVVRVVVERLAAAGAVDDAAFAATRARRLTRAGRSRVAVAAHLAGRGVSGEALRAALPEDAEVELAAAVACVRRRRLGAFRPDAPGPDTGRSELAALARAGFAREAASRALAMPRELAEDLLTRLRLP